MQGKDNQRNECPTHRRRSQILNAPTANTAVVMTTAAVISVVHRTRAVSGPPVAVQMTEFNKQDLQQRQILFLLFP